MYIKPLKQIAKEVRTQLKQEFPGCKFSVRTEYYSMGQSLHVTLVKTPFEVFRTVDEIRAEAVHGEQPWQTNEREQLVHIVQERYDQVNCGWLRESKLYNDTGKKLLLRVRDIAQKDNWDNSDIQTDYFDVHFYLHLNVGSWERPLEVVA
jgi:hypothetical protein